MSTRSTIERLQNQMSEMQENHQKTRDEYERILKQFKQENQLLNQQVKQHLTEQQSTPTQNPTRKSFVEIRIQKLLISLCFSLFLRSTSRSASESNQPELFLYKHLVAWRDAFTELTIYIEERLKNNNRSLENNEKVDRCVFCLKCQLRENSR